MSWSDEDPRKPLIRHAAGNQPTKMHAVQSLFILVFLPFPSLVLCTLTHQAAELHPKHFKGLFSPPVPSPQSCPT